MSAPIPPSAQPAPANTAQLKNGCLGCLSVVVGAVALLVLYVWLSAPSPAEKARSAAIDSEKLCADSRSAYSVSQKFAAKLLKAPSTAKFPEYREISVKYVGNCIHQVDAFVDAQNSFGAQIRTKYHAEVQNQKGSDNWKALDVTLAGQ